MVSELSLRRNIFTKINTTFKFVIKKIKNHGDDSLYRNSYYIMANSVIASALGFLFWMFIARYYTPTDVGYVVAIISIASILVRISQLGLDTSIIRYFDSEKNKISLINTCYTVNGLFIILLSVIFLLGLEIWVPKLLFVRESWFYSFIFIIFTVCTALLTLTGNAFIAAKKAKYFLFQSTIWSIIRIPLPIFFAPFFPHLGIIVSWAIALLIALLISIFVFLRKIISNYLPFPNINKQILKKIRNFSGGNYVSNLARATPSMFLPLIILQVLRPEDASFFYIPWMICAFLFIMPNALSYSLLAESSSNLEELGKNVKKSLKLGYALLLPTVVIILFVGERLLLLFGSVYSDKSAYLLNIFAFSSLFAMINNMYFGVMRVKQKNFEIALISIFFAFGILVLSYFLLSFQGLKGAGYAWIIMQGILFCYSIYRLLNKRSDSIIFR